MKTSTKPTYWDMNEYCDKYLYRKSSKIRSNKIDNKKLSKREKRLIKCAFKTGWNTYDWELQRNEQGV